ncbi:MAG TPA: hypothetical protein VMT35_07910 [Ignavibacteriaceae bacterium]|nr:hypothetical protein [Ignavibacteriaceae bacterium]
MNPLKKQFYTSVASFLFIFLLFCENIHSQGNPDKDSSKELNMLQEKIKQFVPVEITFDTSLLSKNEKLVVRKLFYASQIIDSIFLEQAYSRNEEILNNLTASSSKEDKLRLEYFRIMFGPFDRLDHNKPLIGSDEKPKGADFYPSDMSKDEFNKWIEQNPNDYKAFTSEFTVIRRDDGKLTAVPYSEYYREKLLKAGKLLREAAEYSDNPSLKKYLELRAKAFETNDYYESDMAWMDLKDNLIEVVIGPYEVYEDELFNYKASFESFLAIKDPAESEKLKKFAVYLKEIENNLPIEEKYKNFKRGSESPISVVNEIFSAGDAKAGIQTLAFNLPNDERVRSVKGSKKVMFKNLHDAKFSKLLKPIAEIILDKDQIPFVTFDAFFNHTLMHEISHGVGPGFITVNGRKTEVKKELKETYSTLEECKADILGIYNNVFMIQKRIFKKEFDKELYVTFLAGVFRSVRFGISEAHGGSNAIIYNFILENGGFQYNDKTKKVSVNFDKIAPAVKKLAGIILKIQATGDYSGAKTLISKYSVNSATMEKLRSKLANLPVDIRPIYQIENSLK